MQIKCGQLLRGSITHHKPGSEYIRLLYCCVYSLPYVHLGDAGQRLPGGDVDRRFHVPGGSRCGFAQVTQDRFGLRERSEAYDLGKKRNHGIVGYVKDSSKMKVEWVGGMRVR